MAIATLSIDIVAKLANIERDMNRFVNMTQSGMSKVGSAIMGLVPAIGAVASVAGGLEKLIGTQRQFDVLDAGLQTATGSAENAADAFEALQSFAAKTPYDLAQTTDAFTKLVNLGLTPSERALTSYGNTAASMGKDLSQLVEAVADATTGEFERLKEFGIKAKQEGDKVALTFRGVTTTIGNNAAEIENFLISLGENQFGGAMEKRMASLDGLISNLGDEWDKLFLNISKQGIGSVISEGVQTGINALAELNAMVASGEAAANVDALAAKFAGFGDDLKRTSVIIGEFFAGIESDGGGAVEFLSGAFKDLPENIRAFIQIGVVEVAAGLDKIKAYAVSLKDGVAAVFNDDTLDDVGRRLEQSLGGINDARRESIDSIIAERDAAIASSSAQIDKAKELRAEYDRTQAASAASAERLAKFKVASTGQLNAAQAKLMDEYRLAEEKATLSSVDFQIKEAEREAAKKLAIAGSNADLRRKVEQELAARIAAIKAGETDVRSSLEHKYTETVASEAARRVGIEQAAAAQIQAAYDRAAMPGTELRGDRVVMNAGGQNEFVSSWDALGNYVGDLKGFATGGSFLVGGAGGTDSQLVSFRATPDERVTIETPEQQRGGRGNVTVNVNVNGGNPQTIINVIKQAMRMDPMLLSAGAGRAG